METILQYQPQITQEDIDSVNSYLSSGGFLTEYKVTREFEDKLAALMQTRYCSVVPNGTLSLNLIGRSLGLSKGSTVIVPNFTMAATAMAPIEIGCQILLCDVEYPSLCLDLNKLKFLLEKYGDIVEAIFYVPINGRYPSYPIENLKSLADSYNCYLVEDAAQALGSLYPDKKPVGSISSLSSVSFSMPKIITTGQGGAIFTNSEKYYHFISQYKNFGRTSAGNDTHNEMGSNLKFTDLQAVIGMSQLHRIHDISIIKKNHFEYLKSRITNSSVQFLPNDLRFTIPWFFEVVTDYRDELAHYLRDLGIQTRAMYPSLNNQSFIHDYLVNDEFDLDFENSNLVSNKGLWLPSHPLLSKNDLSRIITAINEFKP